MDMTRAREFGEIGLIGGATVTKEGEGWTVELSGRFGQLNPFIETLRGELRIFQSLETASRAIESMGVKKFLVVLEVKQ